MEVVDPLERDAGAQRVLGSLSDWEPGAVRALSVALEMAEPPIRELSRPLDYLSDVLADPTLSGGLARLSMRRALRRIRQRRDVEVLLERLEGVDEAPWQELRAALAD